MITILHLCTRYPPYVGRYWPLPSTLIKCDNHNSLKMALVDTRNIKCQWESLGRSGNNNSGVSRWTWGSRLTLHVPGDTWAVIPAEVESPLAPIWLFTHAPPHTCHGDSPRAKEYAIIPLIHSIWWHHVGALLHGRTSKHIILQLWPNTCL